MQQIARQTRTRPPSLLALANLPRRRLHPKQTIPSRRTTLDLHAALAVRHRGRDGPPSCSRLRGRDVLGGDGGRAPVVLLLGGRDAVFAVEGGFLAQFLVVGRVGLVAGAAGEGVGHGERAGHGAWLL